MEIAIHRIIRRLVVSSFSHACAHLFVYLFVLDFLSFRLMIVVPEGADTLMTLLDDHMKGPGGIE